MTRPSVYLAGPDVFRPDAVEIGRAKVALCAEYGFEGLYPLDNEIDGPKHELDTLIYRGNMGMIRRADFGIFNLSPYMGLSADVGTAFELGAFAYAGKPGWGHTTDGRTILERAQGLYDLRPIDGRGWVAPDGNQIEDFGNHDNLMIDGYLDEGANVFVVDTDVLSGLRRCLDLARRYFAAAA